MQSLCPARKVGTGGGARLVADGDDIIQPGPGLQRFFDAARLFVRDLDSALTQDFNHERVQLAGLQARAFGKEQAAAVPIEQRLRHLTAGAL